MTAILLFRRRGVQTSLLLAIFAALICLRMPEIVLRGRFWCEEGYVFYHNAWVLPPGAALFNSFGGYLNLFANGASLAARWLLPVALAPYMTITVALLMQLCPLLLLLSARDPWLDRAWIRACAALLVVLVPAVEEIWLNSLHCQFQFTLCCGIILALQTGRPSGRGSWFRYLVLFLAPLCGPVPITLLPLFIARSLLDRSFGRMCQTAPLLIGSILQLSLFLHHEPTRTYSLDPVLLLDIFTVRHLMLPYLGVAHTGIAARLIEARRAAGHVPLKATLLPIPIFGAFLILCLRRRRRQPAFWFLAAGGIIACASYFGALGGAEELIDARVGGRYIFVPQALFSLAILALAATASGWTSRGAALAVCWLLLLGGLEYLHPWDLIADGPSWRQEVAQWQRNQAYTLQAWPGFCARVELPIEAWTARH